MIYQDLILLNKKGQNSTREPMLKKISGAYPGAQVPFRETLVEHIKELLNSNPSYGIN